MNMRKTIQRNAGRQADDGIGVIRVDARRLETELGTPTPPGEGGGPPSSNDDASREECSDSVRG